MQKRILKISQAERQALEAMRDHDRRAYVRERAAALLKIAEGWSAHAVAQRGLLRKRKADTVYGWLKAYQERGLPGLYQRPRRGGKILCL
jgi:transposase